MQKAAFGMVKGIILRWLYTAEGERLFCERHNCRIYLDNRGVYWHFKVADNPAYTLPAEISKAYLNHEISIWDVYVHWRKNESCY